jgi:hypothetical protein
MILIFRTTSTVSFHWLGGTFIGTQIKYNGLGLPNLFETEHLINMQEWALVHVHGTLKDYLTASPRIWLD